jgi:hypothetical protein
MAFCNDDVGCGHGCGRQDNLGGDCDCYKSDCKDSSRYKPPPPEPLATFYVVRCNSKYYHTENFREPTEDEL